MRGVFNAKKLVIWHAIAPTYGATTVIIMDMSPWTAQIRHHHLVHQHAAGLTQMTGVEDPSLDITVTPGAHTMITRTDPDSVAPDLAPVTTDTGVAATRTPIEVTPDHSIDLPIEVFYITEALVLTATAMTCLIRIGILPKMTADLDINPGDNTTDQQRDLHPLHSHYLGNIRTRDTNKSQLTTHHQSTTAQMTMTVTQRMI